MGAMNRSRVAASLLLLMAGLAMLPACSPAAQQQKTFEVNPALTPDGERWPLTVDKAVIVCGTAGRLMLGVPDESGKMYWLNGLAKQEHTYADLYQVWKDDPDVPGLKIGMWLTDYGNDQCGN